MATVIPFQKCAPDPEEVDVVCRAAGPHKDLVGRIGILVLDCDASGTVREATFDPDEDYNLPNAIMPVERFRHAGERLELLDDDGTWWRFEEFGLELYEDDE